MGPTKWEYPPDDAPASERSQDAGESSELDVAHAAHERQRALVRASLLHVPDGHIGRPKVHEHDRVRTRTTLR